MESNINLGNFCPHKILDAQQAKKRLEVLSSRENPSAATDEEAEQLSSVIEQNSCEPVKIERRAGNTDPAGWYKVKMEIQIEGESRQLPIDALTRKSNETLDKNTLRRIKRQLSSDNPFYAELKEGQIRWRSHMEVNTNHVKEIVAISEQNKRHLHINTGTHGDSQSNTIANQGDIYEDTAFQQSAQSARKDFRTVQRSQWVSLHLISSLSPPIYPPSIDVLDAWCYSEKSSPFKSSREEEVKEPAKKAAFTDPESQLRALMPQGYFFGSADWEHLGERVQAPPIPSTLPTILQEHCPYGKGELVKDSHLLTLIPREITIERMGELGGGFRGDLSDGLRQKIRGTRVPELRAAVSHWSLIYVGNDYGLLPGSRSKNFQNQCKLMKKGYEAIPVVDSVLSVLSHFKQTGEILVPDKPRSWMRCAEEYDGGIGAMVGRLSGGGLGLYSSRRGAYDSYYLTSGYFGLGLGVLRKF